MGTTLTLYAGYIGREHQGGLNLTTGELVDKAPHPLLDGKDFVATYFFTTLLKVVLGSPPEKCHIEDLYESSQATKRLYLFLYEGAFCEEAVGHDPMGKPLLAFTFDEVIRALWDDIQENNLMNYVTVAYAALLALKESAEFKNEPIVITLALS